MSGCCVGSTGAVRSSAGGVVGCVSGVGVGWFGCVVVRWVDSRTIQDIDRWEVWRLGGGIYDVGFEEDLGHFRKWQVGYWARSWYVCNDDDWSVSDGGECVHICTWVVVVRIGRC